MCESYFLDNNIRFDYTLDKLSVNCYNEEVNSLNTKIFYVQAGVWVEFEELEMLVNKFEKNNKYI